MAEELDPKVLDRMKFLDRVAHERQVLEDLIIRYPRELEPYETLRSRVNQYAPDESAALRARFVGMAERNSDDPLALLLAAEALFGKDTAKSIRLLEDARTKAPNFPWLARSLGWPYFNGKTADAKKGKENLEAFFTMCPASTDGLAQWLLAKDPTLQPKVAAAVAAALRARLEKETDPTRLKDYKTLWGQEFRTRPPQEHEALRAQLRQDLKRLKALNPAGDAEWQALLINGYKQSGASKETVTAMEDRLVREYPQSNEAYGIVSARWQTAHQEPGGQDGEAAWVTYQKEYEEALKQWIRNYPDDTYLQRYEWFDAIRQDETVSEKDGVAALDAFLAADRDFRGPAGMGTDFPNAAQFLIARGWQPARALDLLKQARTSIESDRGRDREDDNLTEEDLTSRRQWQTQQDQRLNGLLLEAAQQAGRPEEALKLRASIEAPLPEKKLQSEYWWNRARFEALQNHAQDALAYYQMALQSRIEPPKPFRGKLRDDLTAETRTLWKAQGGTETAWSVWSKAPSAGPEQPADGRWEKPTESVPAFELPDLSGKIWRLKDLQGKAVLINVWATWCGPCQAELPHLEKFYEKVKNRSDLQVLTFDIDENLGLVAPYLKEKGYTFPVLPAFSTGVLDDFAVPQTWVVDARGVWRWKQTGYVDGSDADFEKELLGRLDRTETSVVSRE
jgi:thiol-disulfide isomerase/thioredoxin